MTLQEKYRSMLGEAEEAFSKSKKDFEEYREETAKSICSYIVRIFSSQIEKALELEKIEDGTITEIKKTFILGCSIQENEFTVHKVDEAKTKLTSFALNPLKLKGKLMKKLLKRLKEKLKEKGIEDNIDMDNYNGDFQVIVTLSSE